MNLLGFKKEPFGSGKSRDTSALLIIDGDALPILAAMPNRESYSIVSIEVLKGALR